MSLLDDVRRLLDDPPACTDRGGRGECYYCHAPNYEGDYLDFGPFKETEHRDGCPLLSMPKIVQVLEASEHAVDVLHDDARHYEVRTMTHAAVEKIEKALEA
jgi:hypothetical protein